MTYSTYGPGSLPQLPPRPRHESARAVQLWLIGALLTLLGAMGIAFAFVIGDDAAAVVADPPQQSAPGNGESEPTEGRSVPAPPTNCLVECTEAPMPPDGSESEAHYSGSDDAAAEFVQDLASGNVASAHDALCGAGMSEFPTPDELLADFYATLGVSEITGARLTGVHAADDVSDAVVFELDTDVGPVTAEVFVVQEAASLTVCGYEVAR